MKQVQGPAGLFRLLCIAAALVLGCHGVARSAEPNAEKEIQNIGFMKSPPLRIRSKFPICEEFLDVNWIDFERQIGYVKYDAQFLDRNGEKKKEWKKVWALVVAKGPKMSFRYDIYNYVAKNGIDDIINIVRNGESVRSPGAFSIRYQGKVASFRSLSAPILAGNKKTICIAYSDGRLAWIIEARNVEQTFTEDFKRSSTEEKTDDFGTSFRNRYLKRRWVIDVNGDGRTDFISDPLMTVGGIAVDYSLGNRYCHLESTVTPEGHMLTSNCGSKQCETKDDGFLPLLTDGKSFFVTSDCNLSELTSE